MHTNIFILEWLYCVSFIMKLWYRTAVYLTSNYVCVLQRQERFTDCTALLEMEKKVRLQNTQFHWTNQKHMGFSLYRRFQSYVTPHACFLSISGEKDVREACRWVGRGVEGESMWSQKAFSDWLFYSVLGADWLRGDWSVKCCECIYTTLSMRAIQPTRVKPV